MGTLLWRQLWRRLLWRLDLVACYEDSDCDVESDVIAAYDVGDYDVADYDMISMIDLLCHK